MASKRSTPLAKQQRSVSFYERVRLIQFRRFSDEETKAAWYTRAEMKRMKEATKETVALIDRREPNKDPTFFCTRGLETMTQEGKSMKLERREFALSIVLSEQRYQEEVGIPDPRLIAYLYAEASQTSKQLAISMARSDEVDVNNSSKLFCLRPSFEEYMKEVHHEDDLRGPRNETPAPVGCLRGAVGGDFCRQLTCQPRGIRL